MTSSFFDIENLQKLSYDRCTLWAQQLECIAKRETCEELDVDTLHYTYPYKDNENDSGDALSSMESDGEHVTLDSEDLRKFIDVTRFSLSTNKTTLPDNIKHEEQCEIIDLFNQTLPVISEHNRQLKESGFEKILNSFDTKRIEDKVGSWLNRHNSLFGGEHHLLSGYCNKDGHETSDKHIDTDISCKYLSPSNNIGKNDSDDSLQSGETARYIRSSRATGIKHFASTNTLIKTYRTREALYDKQFLEKDDCLKTIQHRRHMPYDQLYYQKHYGLHRLQRSCKHEIQQISSQKQRRKVLRKRICSNSCSTMDSTFDSDSSYEYNRRLHRKNCLPCCDKHHFSPAVYNCRTVSGSKMVRSRRCAIKMPSAYKNRMYYYSHSKNNSFSTSSSSPSLSSTSRKRRAIKDKNSNLYKDSRPYKREAECSCRNSRKLCEKYKHFVNSSTDEWSTENYSPKKPRNTESLNTEFMSCITASYAIENFGVLTRIGCEDSKMNKNLKAASPKNVINNVPLKNQKSSKTLIEKSIEISSATDDCENSEWELKAAIEESKKLYEIEQNRLKKNSGRQKKEQAIMPTRALRQTSKRSEEYEKQKPTTSKKATTKNRKNANNKEANKKLRCGTESEINRDVTSKSNRISDTLANITDESFFSASRNKIICNSTALSTKVSPYNKKASNPLANRQDLQENLKTKSSKPTNSKNKKPVSKNKRKILPTISEDQKTSNTVTSTTIRSPENNFALTSTEIKIKDNYPDNEMSCNDPHDCSLVTSTTHIELPSPRKVNHTVIARDTNKTASTLSQQQAPTDILIYTPKNRSMVPASNVTSDGYFTVTKEHLSKMIGEKKADKFMKCYLGRKRFSCNSTVYYRPPSWEANNDSSSSDSYDELDILGLCGDLYELNDENRKETK